MTWTLNNTIIREGRGWTDDNGIQHPTSWGRWSDAEKQAAGLVWKDDPKPYDNRFYWDADTPKALEDVPAVDEDGAQVITEGLKSQQIKTLKAQANGLLEPTDWLVVRKMETGEDMPADVIAYRQAVRTASNAIEAKVKAAKTHAAFMKLFDAPVDKDGMPTGNAPINDWPEQE